MKFEELVQNCVSNIVELCCNSIEEKQEFSDIVLKTQEEVNSLGIKVLEWIIDSIEKNFDAYRDKHKIVVRNKNKIRHLLTPLGVIKINHTLYFDKERENYFFAVDEILKLEKRSRIDQVVKSQLVSAATQSSFGKAASMNGNISRQSVFNLIKKLRNIEAPIKTTMAQSKVPNVYVEADEDHIHLTSGNAAEVKLIYVHEGYDAQTPGRVKLKNPRYFASTCDDADTIWNDVAEYVSSSYGTFGDKVHLSGDGANWIRQGLRAMPLSMYHADRFHINKALIIVSRGNKRMLSEIRQCVYSGDDKRFLDILQKRYVNDKMSKLIYDNVAYLWRNMDYISTEHRCCAEGHVSHVLSARMSSRPMGWSIEGAERIARLRCFMFNGGNFLSLIKNQSQVQLEEDRKATEIQTKRYNIVERAIHNRYYVKSGNICSGLRELLDSDKSFNYKFI